jgi:YVTN family beta-propeller protein
VGTWTGDFVVFGGLTTYQDIWIDPPILVTNTDDSGPGSLRQAIIDANTNIGNDVIGFNIPGTGGTHTIQPLSALPVITDPVIIDGFTQLGAEKATATTPPTLLIELDGINLITDHYTSGLMIHGGSSTIRGLMINRFGDDGIHIQDLGGNVIEGNFIGVDANGLAKGNYDGALRIWNSPDNVIGGDLPEQRNVMASDGSHIIQILLPQAANNVIKGNYIGIGPDGDTQLGTSQVGVRIDEQAHENTIGPSNVISGNLYAGISIEGQNEPNNNIIGNFIGTNANGTAAIGNQVFGIAIGSNNTEIRGNVISSNGGTEQNPGLLIANGASGNTVAGNFIGTNAAGTAPLPNSGSGINIGDAPGNTIGGPAPEDRNIIVGGIQLAGISTTGNSIQGNYIGPDVTGNASFGLHGGIVIYGEASNNEVGPGNVLSGNSVNAVVLGSGTSGNSVFGNYIGVNADGTEVLPNGSTNVVIENSSGNIIGGPNPEDRNVISGAAFDYGIFITGAASTDNVVTNNYIGTNAAGTEARGNANNGVLIQGGASNNVIGGYNLISGNGFFGVSILGTETTGNQVINNLIGTNINGNALIGNADDGINISDASFTVISGNVICGAGVGTGYTPNNGIEILGSTATRNTITDNYIGTNANSDPGLGNGFMGIQFHSGANTNTIGPGNVISGNLNAGIYLDREGVTGNVIMGNKIGTNVAGTAALGNVGPGIDVNGAPENTIGPGNIISGNHTGISIGPFGEPTPDNGAGNWIKGNIIGTDASGTAPIPNGFVGVDVHDVQETTIGGLEEIDRNIISGNNIGIVLARLNGKENIVLGNYIGTDITGTESIGNDHGIWIGDQGNNNIIGGNSPEARNVISGNEFNGISIVEGSTGNRIHGNYIGLAADGDNMIGNGNFGVSIFESAGNYVGGTLPGEGNVISGNGSNGPDFPLHGVHIGHVVDMGPNYVQGNYIGTDATGMFARGNANFGINVFYSTHQVIGGSIENAGNLVSGNRVGIVLFSEDPVPEGGSTSDYNIVQGNIVGPRVNGIDLLLNYEETEPQGNIRGGIMVVNGHNNTIGGIETSQRNIVSGNQRWGIGFGASTGNKVEGNFIGLDIDGEFSLPNGYAPAEGIYGFGLAIYNSSSNIIGGTEPGARNIISGNEGLGIWMDTDLGESSQTTENYIIGNYIGTDHTGTIEIPNTLHGIYLNAGPTNNTIGGGTAEERNIISGNGNDGSSHGIVISDPQTMRNKISGNYIGVDVTGKVALGNTGDGVQLINETSGNIVGGTSPGERNIISGNGVTGMAIYNGASENQIIGNFIGLDVTGTKNIGHPGGTGIYFGLGAHHNIVGGSTLDSANIISGNTGWGGIALEGAGTEYNAVKGNILGTDITGKEEFGNKFGVRIYNGASNNQLGGDDKVEGNLIVNSDSAGVILYNNAGNTDPTKGNQILSNIIHSNGTLGIDLNSDGVTANDVGDIDDGTNSLLNFPELTNVNFSTGMVDIEGNLNSSPNTNYTIQFFVNNLPDDEGYGEGQTYLGSETITTDASGDALISVTYPTMVRYGRVVTATATDPDGNTSEFSGAIGGAQSQILATGNMPLHYQINEDGVPYMLDGSDLQAVQNAFQTWADIPTSEVDFVYDGTTSVKTASATDGINLVTFTDETFLFGTGVLAVAAKTIEMDSLGGEARIIDADIVFNPDWIYDDYRFSTDTYDGYFDIQSVAVHEVGHVIGLIHSGVVESTMFFLIDNTTDKRTLEQDDISWASFRYPKQPEYDQAYGSIAGHVSYGYDQSVDVGGALVLATHEATGEAIHTYSDEDGNFLVPGVPSGNYKVSIEPLDGDVEGFPLTSGNISDYIFGITEYTDFPDEYFSDPEAEINDDPANFLLVNITAGQLAENINLVTNKDITPPYVLSVSPRNDSVGVEVFSQVVIAFSESMDLNSFTDESCYLSAVDNHIYGSFTPLDDDNEKIVFSPDEPLRFNITYELHITAGVTDLKENPLDPEFTSQFTTSDGDATAPALVDIIPEYDEDHVFVTASIQVFFSEAMDPNSTENGFSLVDESGSAVYGAESWDQQNTVLTFTPMEGLLEGMDYTVSVTTGMTDLSLNPLLKDSVLIFSTVPQAAPIITYIGPYDGQTGVSIETPLVVDFSEPINPVTVNGATIRLLWNGEPLVGDFEFLLDNSRVVYRPAFDLMANTTYDIEISDQIFDVSQPSQHLAQGVFQSFTTADVVTQPFIEYLEPPAGSIGAIVQLVGEGFDPNPANEMVYFNGNDAVILQTGLTSIATKVPLGATPGPVYAIVNGQQSNDQYFYVIPATTAPCDEITANVNTGAHSEDVDILPDGGLAYVTNSGSNTVSVIDMNMAVIQQNIAVGETPLKIDINPAGTLAYVTNFHSHTVSVIDLSTNTVIHTIPVGVNPYGVVVTPDGSRVYVANYTSKDISIIDVDPNSGGFDMVVASVGTESQNRDIEIAPDGGLALVAGSGGVLILNTDPNDIDFNQVVARVNTESETNEIDIIPEGGLALATTIDGNIVMIDVLPSSDAFGQVIAKVNTESEATDLAIGPEGMFVYMTNVDYNTVSVYKLEYGGVSGSQGSYNLNLKLVLINTIDVKEAPHGLVVDAVAERVLITHDVEKGSVTTINICCGPLVIESAIGNLVTSIRNAIDAGILSKGNGNALLVKLDHVLARVSKDRINEAIGQLNAFINQVITFVEDGTLPPQIGSEWIEAAKAIIQQLMVDQGKGYEFGMGNQLQDPGLPVDLRLQQNYPNPFSQSTRIDFEIPKYHEGISVPVLMRLYNTSGQVVKTLVSMDMEPGRYSIAWDASKDDGTRVADGIYLLEMWAGDERKVMHVSVIK